MKNRSNTILRFGKEFFLGDFPVSAEKNLGGAELRCLQARQIGGISVGEFDDEKKLFSEIEKLIFEVGVMVGADPVEDEAVKSKLVTQFIFFLKSFGFADLNVKEILLAFYLNLVCYKFPSGYEISKVELKRKKFNLDYASEVLKNYLSIRKIVDGKVEKFLN